MAEKKFCVSLDELQAAYTELQSTSKVAKRFNVSKKLILNYMKRYGLERAKRATPEERAGQIERLAKDGLHTKEIAERLGIDQTLVNRYLGRFGIQVERYHKGHTVNHAGYVLVRKPDHPNATKSGYIREHVLLMSESIGRPLNDDECVHHKDGNKANNRLENLELMKKFDHKKLHSRNPRKRNVKKFEDIV